MSNYPYQRASNPYGGQQQVGLNYMSQGSSGQTMEWVSRFDFWKIFFEPFVTREKGRWDPTPEELSVDPNALGSVTLGLKKMAISMLLEVSFVFLLVTFTVGVAAGAFISGANILLVGIVVGAVHAMTRYASVAGRHTPHLPRHGDPGFTWYAMCRGDIGIVIGVFYMIAQYGGASLAMWFLCIPGLHISDAWLGLAPPTFIGNTFLPAASRLSNFGLFAIYTSSLVIIYWVHGFSQTFTTHRYSFSKRFVHGAQLQAATIFVITQLTIHLGVFSLNPLIFYAGAVGAGAQTVVTGSALGWVLILLLAPFAAGPIAAFFVWFFWNVSAMSPGAMQDGYKKDILASAGGDGGAPHTAVGRHEVNPNPEPQSDSAQYSAMTGPACAVKYQMGGRATAQPRRGKGAVQFLLEKQE